MLACDQERRGAVGGRWGEASSNVACVKQSGGGQADCIGSYQHHITLSCCQFHVVLADGDFFGVAGVRTVLLYGPKDYKEEKGPKLRDGEIADVKGRKPCRNQP